jgi:hypothetical protein
MLCFFNEIAQNCLTLGSCQLYSIKFAFPGYICYLDLSVFWGIRYEIIQNGVVFNLEINDLGFLLNREILVVLN